MDGNGRWAQGRSLPRIEGHREGARSVRAVVRACRELGVEALTLYAFSSQNWSRPPGEVNGLMELLVQYLVDERTELLDNEIRMKAIGRVFMLPPWVREPLDELARVSADNRKMTLCIALSYGGREAIVDAVKRALAEGTAPGDMTEARFSQLLPTGDLPPLDLLIRTSGELRLSNFLLWESAYSELYFTEVLWPDFRKPQLIEALDSFGRRERRYGLTSAQVQDEPAKGNGDDE